MFTRLVSTMFAAALCTGQTLSADPERPNILLLYADDLGYGDLGCYNKESKIPTPALDALAARGIRFTDGHSSSGICTPSRYALLTGRHHWRDFHGIVGALGASVFKPERLTLPEMLQDHGYHTACIGKWHLGWNWTALHKPNAKPKRTEQWKRKVHYWPHDQLDWTKTIPDGPLAHGFDHYFGDSVINFPPYCWIENDKVTQAPNATFLPGQHREKTKEGNWEARPGPALADWDFYQVLPTLANKGVAHVKARAQSKGPWFLYFSFPSPHAPIVPNNVFDDTSQAGAYGDFVHQTDSICGRILQALKDSGQDENTLVIFTADNGAEKYAYPRVENHQHWSSTPLRGLKRDIYEGGHRVPFIIKPHRELREALDRSRKQKNQITLIRQEGEGLTSDALVSQIDIMATVAALLEAELPEKNAAEDSHNLLPLLQGRSATPPRTTHIHNTWKDAYAIRHGDYVLIDRKDGYHSARNKQWERSSGYPEDDNEPTELYHLKNDLAQKHNLASKHPELVKSMQARLKRIRHQGSSAPRLEGSN